jgi:hypothetical protein
LSTDTASHSATYSIAQFDFPVLGRTTRKLYISQLHAIYLDPPPPVPVASFTQYNDAEAVAPAQAVIAPLLTTPPGLANRYPAIYVNEVAGRVIVTWKITETNEAIQAVLFANGDIRFSYRSIGDTRCGVVLITSGTEAWRTPVVIASTNDLPNDISPGMPAMLDVTSVTINRIGNTNLLQVVIKLAAPFDRTKIGSGNYGVYQIRFGDPFFGAHYLFAYFSGSGSGSDELDVPSWGTSQPSPAMRANGNTITITVAQEQWLPNLAGADVIDVSTYWKGSAVDEVAWLVGINAPAANVRTSFANASSIDSITGPIEETFTLGILNPSAVWEKVFTAYGLDATKVDGVAIYQNFYTDIVLYAGAYSTGGNPGVDGMVAGTRSASARQRSPALLHMNAIRYRYNANERDAAFVLMHEFGHRWLQFINIIDDTGTKTRVLNPLTSHPAQYVDTRAAFSVYTSADASVMGGATFTDNHDGTFSTPPAAFAWSYSWLDLYLMGLAAPNEIPPFFYLTNSSPILGMEYSPPANQTYSATRKDLTLTNVINAMGVRKPAFPDTQREMRLLFVLLSDPAHVATADDVNEVARYAAKFRDAFGAATNHRATITSTFAVPPAVRRRVSGH